MVDIACIPEALKHAASGTEIGTGAYSTQIQPGSVSRPHTPEAATPSSTDLVERAAGDLPADANPQPAHASSSVFARNEDAPVHTVPMRVIHRPLPSELDEDKVQTFMDEMRAGDVFTPIEVVKVRAPLKTDPTGQVHNFYFAMGGCHRYEATKRLGLESIRARIINVPPAAMRVYLGSGCPF